MTQNPSQLPPQPPPPQQGQPQPPPAYPPQYQQAPMPQQPVYQQPVYVPNQKLSPTVTIGDWLLWLILSFIPLVGFIMLIVYACDSVKPSRANLAKLILILWGIAIVVGGVLWVLFFSAIMAHLGN